MAVAAARPRLVHREFRGTNVPIRRTNLINLGVTEKTPFAMRDKLQMDDIHNSIKHSALMRRLLLVTGAGALATSLAACGLVSEPPPTFKGTDITGAGWARGFDLTDHTGRRRTLAAFKNKVALAFFGYTNCPDACPTALAEMAQVVKQLGPDGGKVQGLFITVDPERDTPERLASYVPAFHPSFLGLRGTQDEVEKAKKEFKIYSNAQNADKRGHSGHGTERGSYMVDHSTGIYIFDKQGRARLYVSANGRSVGAIVHDVGLLLEETTR